VWINRGWVITLRKAKPPLNRNPAKEINKPSKIQYLLASKIHPPIFLLSTLLLPFPVQPQFLFPLSPLPLKFPPLAFPAENFRDKIVNPDLDPVYENGDWKIGREEWEVGEIWKIELFQEEFLWFEVGGG
jgi:hypothetical protein